MPGLRELSAALKVLMIYLHHFAVSNARLKKYNNSELKDSGCIIVLAHLFSAFATSIFVCERIVR